MSIIICEHNQCTGCAACRDICPKQCISMQADELDALYPIIDENKCVKCYLCKNTCPNIRRPVFHSPNAVWAAWSNDNHIRQNSASGGISYELYRFWIRNGGVATGVVYDRNEGCHFILIDKESDIRATQNSKYTFSDTHGIYKAVQIKLKTGVPVLFIGTPCQVAGLYSYLRVEYENLTTVDLICHGMPPFEYLNQHVEYIERKNNERTSILCFRDPKYHTYSYTFTLKNEVGKEFYKKCILNFDNYQIGYHKALIYRENCYHCQYARKERISDLTIGDFSGIGKFAPFEYEKRNINCVIQNTRKGKELLESLADNITYVRRPDNEAFEVEKQLQSPSHKHINRDIFIDNYRITRDFESSANKSLMKDKIDNIKELATLRVKKVLRFVLPQRIIAILRNK